MRVKGNGPRDQPAQVIPLQVASICTQVCGVLQPTEHALASILHLNIYTNSFLVAPPTTSNRNSNSPCQNGILNSQRNGCICIPGFTGVYCEMSKSEFAFCEKCNPCLSCTVKMTNQVFDKTPSHSKFIMPGPTQLLSCQYQMFLCICIFLTVSPTTADSNAPCESGILNPEQNGCICTPGYTGVYCEISKLSVQECTAKCSTLISPSGQS